MPTERPPLVGEVVRTFADRGCCVVSATDPPVVSLGFLDRNRYYFFQVAPQLSSRGWVDPVPDPLLLRTSGSAGNQTQDLWICSQKLWPLDHRGGLLLEYSSLNWKFSLGSHAAIPVLDKKENGLARYINCFWAKCSHYYKFRIVATSHRWKSDLKKQDPSAVYGFNFSTSWNEQYGMMTVFLNFLLRKERLGKSMPTMKFLYESLCKTK
jgi:hypothetical protein